MSHIVKYRVPVYVFVDLELEEVTRVVVHDEQVTIDGASADSDSVLRADWTPADALADVKHVLDLAEEVEWPGWEYGF